MQEMKDTKISDQSEKQNLTFTTDFPVSLLKEFDGTQEIPYAPDLRPSLEEVNAARGKKAVRKPTRKPDTAPKSVSTLPPKTETLGAQFPVNTPSYTEKPAPVDVKQAVRPTNKKENPKSFRRARVWLTLILILFLLGFLTFLAMNALQLWRQKKNEASHNDPISEVSGSVSSDISSETSARVSENNSDLPSVSGSTEGPYLSTDVQMTVELFEESIPGKKSNPLFTTRIAVPTIVYTQHPDVEAEINRRVSELFEGYKTIAADLARKYVQNCTDTSVAGTYECSCSLACSREDIVTLMVNSYTYNGGATSLSTVDCYNFKISDGRILELDEVIDDLSGLGECAIRSVDKSLVWQALYEKYIRENICDTWYFSSDGLVLIYQKYSIGPGASELIEVVVQDETLEQMLTEEFKAK